MPFAIRNARAADYENVVRILNQVQRLHTGWRPDIYKACDCPISQDAFRLAVKESAFFVAETEGKVVGVLELVYRHIETPVHVTRDILFIESMAVDEAYRGMGIGHLFFDKAKEIKEERHLDGIELQVNARNREARAMYAKYGFAEKSINMELPETPSMSKEEIVQSYFQAWLEKDIEPLKRIFSDRIVLSECYGPEYHGLSQILKWFADWNRRGSVLQWNIKRFLHQGEATVVEWYFECDYNGEISGFDGVSVIDFDEDGKILCLKEFESKAKHEYPYD